MKKTQKTRNPIQFEISEQQLEKKQFLIDKGINLSAKFRNYLDVLYERENNPEVA